MSIPENLQVRTASQAWYVSTRCWSYYEVFLLTKNEPAKEVALVGTSFGMRDYIRTAKTRSTEPWDCIEGGITAHRGHGAIRSVGFWPVFRSFWWLFSVKSRCQHER